MVIYSYDRLRQPVDFSGLEFKGTSPSDVDLCWDVKGRGWIVVEFKLEGVGLPTGQRILLEGMVKQMRRPVLVLVAEHTQVDYTKPVMAAECRVSHYLTDCKEGWRIPNTPVTVSEVCDWFIASRLGA